MSNISEQRIHDRAQTPTVLKRCQFANPLYLTESKNKLFTLMSIWYFETQITKYIRGISKML